MRSRDCKSEEHVTWLKKFGEDVPLNLRKAMRRMVQVAPAPEPPSMVDLFRVQEVQGPTQAQPVRAPRQCVGILFYFLLI